MNQKKEIYDKLKETIEYISIRVYVYIIVDTVALIVVTMENITHFKNWNNNNNSDISEITTTTLFIFH